MERPGPSQIDCDVLQRMYRDSDIDSMIAPSFADALYSLVRRVRPVSVLEIGMAHGASSLAILTALEENGLGELTSIDPYQNSGEWSGTQQVRSAGLQHRHHLIAEPDYLALPELLRSGTSLDLAYVDGWHTFDYTLLDFFFIDKMLTSSGIVGFNDCHYPAVARVLSFVMSHRRYETLDVGLPADRKVISRRGFLPLARWTGRKVSSNDRYFKKIQDWEPDFRFWADF